MTQIVIRRGTYRNQPVENMTFTLVKDLTVTKKGSFVTVQNDGQFPGFSDKIRVNVEQIHDFEIIGASQD